MIAVLSPFANHLWQSTLFAGLAVLLALALRSNRAQTRHWLWLAASIKFLIPFSVLIAVGSRFEWRTAPPVALPLSAAIEQFGQPFTLPPVSAVSASVAPAPAASAFLPTLLVAVWFGGCAFVLGRWWVRWRRVRMAVRSASRLAIEAPIAVMSSPTRLEPGVFGVFRPILLLPEGIADRLAEEQLQAILAHELCHVRRRDNLAAAIHMVVEAIFWFHPLVWWIGGRMVEERERACDEEVLRLGSEPQVYAAGILNVCKFYLESPLACASGVTGADLRKRIEAIMTNRMLAGMTPARKLLLAAAGVGALAVPVVIGIVNTPRVHAQSQTSGPNRLVFDVVSVKPGDPAVFGMSLNLPPGGGLKASNVTLKTLIEFAYDIRSFQLSGGPGWIASDKFNIDAKPEHADGTADVRVGTRAQQKAIADQVRERTRSLLADRFQLAIHKEVKELPVYTLVLGKNGHKLRESAQGSGLRRDRGIIDGDGTPIDNLAVVLSFVVGRPVVNRTGLQGDYSFKLEFTEEMGAGGGKPGAPAPAKDAAEVADGAGPSIFTAIQEQLGLRLESTKGPVDTIVIDRAEKPTSN